MVALAPLLLKYKKELAIGAIMFAMASSIYVMNLKIDNLNLKIENQQIELTIEKDSHLQCQLSVGEQKKQIANMKLLADANNEKIGEAKVKAEAVKKAHSEEINKIKGEAKIQSCEDGMKRLWKALP